MTFASIFPLQFITQPLFDAVVQDPLNQLLQLINAQCASALSSNAFTGNQTVAGSLVVTDTPVTATLPAASSIGVDGAISIDKAGTIDLNAKSVYASRGVVNVTSGTTINDGFVAGMRAGVTLAGTMTEPGAATRVMALFAKVDASAGVVTGGQLSAIWADMGAASPSGGWDAETNVIRLQNTTAAAVNALAYMYGKSSFIFDISDNGAGTVVVGTPPTTISGSLKVSVNGNTRYIPFYTNAS